MSITTILTQLLVTPSHREVGSQRVLIITQNLREVDLAYLCTTVLSVDRPWCVGESEAGGRLLLHNGVHLALQKSLGVAKLE